MHLLLSLAFASEAPLTVVGTPSDFVVQQGDRALNPYQFAKLVGDTDTAHRYKQSNFQRKAVGLTGMIGGGVTAYSGLLVGMMGMAWGNEALALAGFGAAATGLVVTPTAASLHVALGRRVHAFTTWYDYDEARALAGELNERREQPEPVLALSIRDQDLSFAAWQGDRPLDPGEFAALVGDSETLRLWRGIRLATSVTGWTLFGGGLYGTLSAGLAWLDDPNPFILALGSVGVCAALAGPVLVYAPKLLYNDLGRWYTREEAEALAGQVGRLAPEPEPRVQVAVGLGSLAVTW